MKMNQRDPLKLVKIKDILGMMHTKNEGPKSRNQEIRKL